MDNPVVKNPGFLNIFKCGENILNRLEATRKRACMSKSRDKYYTEFLRKITDFNNRNDAPLSNENIQGAMHKLIAEEEADDHNVAADTFIHMKNTQRDNANTILTREKLDKLDGLVETLKDLTINDTEYYVS